MHIPIKQLKISEEKLIINVIDINVNSSFSC